jgi:hypothetical protein
LDSQANPLEPGSPIRINLRSQLFVRAHNKPIEGKHIQPDKESLLIRIPNSQFAQRDLILK